MRKKTVIFSFVLIILCALALRFAPILSQRDFWYDEAFTGILLKAPFGQMNQMIFDDVHPPLYYWLAKPWAAVFGYTPFGIRTFSLAMGVATIMSIYWIGNKMFNQKAGLLAAMITAISPFAIEYSQEARMYALFGFLFLWAIWFFYQSIETGKTKYYVLWGIFSGLSFYTHYLALFFFVLFYITHIVYRVIFNKQKIFRSLFGEKGFWLGVGVIAVFFASWLKIFYLHMMKGNLGWIDPSYLSDIPKTLQIFFFGHPPGTGGVPWSNEFIAFFDGTSAGILIFVFIAASITLAWIKDKKSRELFILTMMSFGTLLFLIVLSHVNIKLYVARYFMPAAVLVYLIVGAIAGYVFTKKWAWAAVLIIYGGMLFTLKQPVPFQSGWTQVSDLSSDIIASDSIIVVGNPFDYTSARYYFGEDRVRYYNKGNPHEDFSGWVVVGNENRITDLSQIKDHQNMVIVDGTCDWEGIELVEQKRLDQLAVCALKR